MKNSQKGFINVLLLIIILIVAGGTTAYIISKKENPPPTPTNEFGQENNQLNILPVLPNKPQVSDSISQDITIQLQINESSGNSVTIKTGENAVITWNTKNANQCFSEGNGLNIWPNQERPVSGKFSMSNVSVVGKSQLILICKNGNKTKSTTVTLNVVSSLSKLQQPLSPQPATPSIVQPTTPSPAPTHPNLLPPAPAVDKFKISACTKITEGGNYTLSNDLIGRACIDITNVNNVNIDCNNHSINPNSNSPQNDYTHHVIEINNVKNFSIKNCNISAVSPDTPINIESSNGGVVQNNTLSGVPISISSSSNINFVMNDIRTNLYVTASDNMNIEKNTIKNHGQDPSEGVVRISGNSNKVIGNTIDGESDGIFRSPPGGAFSSDNKSIGADDGIVIGRGEANNNVILQGNTIRNVWDCGIETLGPIFNSQFTDNNITNAGLCGIGAWYFNSFKGNTISNNVINNVPQIFTFLRTSTYQGSHSNFAPPYYFKDNIFTGNKFINPKIGYSNASAHIYFVASDGGSYLNSQPLTDSDLITGNNIFTNNDFGKILNAPEFSPKSMIVDGGGNVFSTPQICDASDRGISCTPDTTYPLH